MTSTTQEALSTEDLAILMENPDYVLLCGKLVRWRMEDCPDFERLNVIAWQTRKAAIERVYLKRKEFRAVSSAAEHSPVQGEVASSILAQPAK